MPAAIVRTKSGAPIRKSMRIRVKKGLLSNHSTPTPVRPRRTPASRHTNPLDDSLEYQTPAWNDPPDRDHENDQQMDPDPDDNDPDPGDGDDGGDDENDEVPDDDGDGDGDAAEVGPVPPGDPGLARAINLLANALDDRARSLPPSTVRPLRTKAREPEPFSGADPDSLSKFLFQCRLYFRANPAQFESDINKVNFALTFLTDVALRWFETGIDEEETNGVYQAWASDWECFTLELKTHFGVADVRGESAELLEGLRMKHGDKITTYNVEFMRLSAHLRWGDDVLCYRYYKGLPDRLQDAISAQPAGKPKTFILMRETALSFDNRYWERQRERSRAKAVTEAATASISKKPSSGNNNNQPNNHYTSNSSNKPANKPPNNNKGNNPSKPATTSSSSSFTPAKPSNPAKPDLSDKLGKDGKLTSEERKRRLDNNLCLFCGNAGHKVNECRKKAASAAKATARKAEVTEKSSEKSSGK